MRCSTWKLSFPMKKSHYTKIIDARSSGVLWGPSQITCSAHIFPQKMNQPVLGTPMNKEPCLLSVSHGKFILQYFRHYYNRISYEFTKLVIKFIIQLFIKDKQRRNWTIRAVTQPLVLWEEGRHLVKCCSNFSEKYVSNKLTHTEETFSCSNPEPTCRRPMTQEEHTHSGVLSEDWSSTCHVSVVTPSWFWLPFNSGKVLECEKYSVDLGSFTILSNQTL